MPSLIPVIKVDEEKCTNCHTCISVCPVKFCNDGSGDVVRVNPDLCIGCGNCISHCTHDARMGIDDTPEFEKLIRNKKPFIAIVAPAAASSFPDTYLNLNTWMISIGATAVFDVSYGAELTIKSYLDHITRNKPACVIAQPCPAIVSYIELYEPGLIKYLAPADSPMLHTLKMVKEYYRQYNNYQVVMISPCFAKKREFVQTGFNQVINLTIQSLRNYLNKNRINLTEYEKTDYINPPAERGVLFSTPGGLLETAMREVPEILHKTRKIEGTEIIYKYLSTLENSINKGISPLIIDCLNCEKGCNAGPGTLNKDMSFDELESLVARRSHDAVKQIAGTNVKRGLKKFKKTLSGFWKPGLYARNYTNSSENKNYRIPDEYELDKVYTDMLKTEKRDFYNCSACGYGNCRDMAVAIFNGLNRPDNCHDYRQKQVQRLHNESSERMNIAHDALESIEASEIGLMSEKLINFVTEQNDALTKLKQIVEESSSVIDSINPIVDSINKISFQTMILSLNASIEAA
ncbi:MAG: 4Fe-4S binding protein, partial [Spirochaetes bacterium]|nr:4Fe-4S binding protein [Spirochaetota bacterium]